MTLQAGAQLTKTEGELVLSESSNLSSLKATHMLPTS